MFYFPNTLSGGRIRNLVVMGFFLIGWGTLGSSTVGASAPNMILIMADDMSWRDCSPFYGQPGGHPLAGEEGAMPPGLTPNMRTLAAQGMRFDACFNATAMCAPTRQQLFTGKYPVRSGAYPNHGEVKPETKSIVHHLRHAGYRVGLMGKRHIGPLVWSNAQPSSSEGPFPFEFIGSGTDTENLDNIAAVEAFMDRNPDQPFCLIITSNNPHGPWDHGDFVADNTTLPVPADCVDTAQFRASYNKYLGEVVAFDAEVGYWMGKASRLADPHNLIFICLTEHGASFPGAKFNCYEQGLRTGCIISWPDQILGGTATDAMVELVDFVPTLIEAAGGTIPSGLDRLDGLSFLSVLGDPTRSHKQYVYGVQTTRGVASQEILDALDGPGEQPGYAMRSVRDTRYKLIWNLQAREGFGPASGALLGWRNLAVDSDATEEARGQAQLMVGRVDARAEFQFYDLQADPFELHNLANEAEYGERIEEMLGTLKAWMTGQGDRGVLTEWAADWNNFPIEDRAHPFDAWAGQHPFVWSKEGWPAADPDGDRRDNRTEWLAGTNPLSADQGYCQSLHGIALTLGESSRAVDLSVTRPRHYQGLGVSYVVESSQSLDSPLWQAVTFREVASAQPLADGFGESASFRVDEEVATSASFYRLTEEALADYTIPSPLFAGEATSANLANFGSGGLGLDNTRLTITVQAMLPTEPLLDGADQARAEVLWKIGGSTGISLVLLGDQIVFSAAKGINGQVNLVVALPPEDFGKLLTLRFTLEPKAAATLFELSGQVERGGEFVVSEIKDLTNYMGNSNTWIGSHNGTLTGVSGSSPFGPLAIFPQVSHIENWSSGSIRYEILGSLRAPLLGGSH